MNRSLCSHDFRNEQKLEHNATSVEVVSWSDPQFLTVWRVHFRARKALRSLGKCGRAQGAFTVAAMCSNQRVHCSKFEPAVWLQLNEKKWMPRMSYLTASLIFDPRADSPTPKASSKVRVVGAPLPKFEPEAGTVLQPMESVWPAFHRISPFSMTFSIFNFETKRQRKKTFWESYDFLCKIAASSSC